MPRQNIRHMIDTQIPFQQLQFCPTTHIAHLLSLRSELRSHFLVPFLQCSLDNRPLRHSINPCLQIREVFRLVILDDPENASLPGDEREVSVCALVALEILASGEDTVQDP